MQLVRSPQLKNTLSRFFPEFSHLCILTICENKLNTFTTIFIMKLNKNYSFGKEIEQGESNSKKNAMRISIVEEDILYPKKSSQNDQRFDDFL